MSAQGMGTGVGKGMGRRRLIAGAAAVEAAVATRTVSAQAPPAKGGSGSVPASSGIGPRFVSGTADTRYRLLNGTSFASAATVYTYVSGGYFNGGGIYATTYTPSGFGALLDLPQGAALTELTFSLLHNVNTTTKLMLLAFSLDGNGGYTLGETDYSTKSGNTVYITVPLSGTLLTVDNDQFAYVAYWVPGTADSTDVLYGARVGYTLPGKAQVYGAAANGTGVSGTTATGPYAVSGHASQNIGVYGLSDGGAFPYGVVGQNNAPGGFSLFGNASAAGSVAFGGTAYGSAIAGQFIGPVNVYGQITLLQQTQPPDTMHPVNAFIVGPGVTKNAAVELPDGSHGLMHCVEAPEPWFEDFGEGVLAGGKAEVKLEAEFLHTVDTAKLHVFLTPHDETHHLAVKARSGGGFSVAASAVGDALTRGAKVSDLNGTFTWRVVAKRRDVKGDRLMRVELPKSIPAPMPPIPKRLDPSPAPPMPAMPPMPPTPKPPKP